MGNDISENIDILNISVIVFLVIIMLYYVNKYRKLNRKLKVLLESDKKHEVFEIDLVKKRFYSSSNFYLFFNELLDVKSMSVYKLYSKLGLNFRSHYKKIIQYLDEDTNSDGSI